MNLPDTPVTNGCAVLGVPAVAMIPDGLRDLFAEALCAHAPARLGAMGYERVCRLVARHAVRQFGPLAPAVFHALGVPDAPGLECALRGFVWNVCPTALRATARTGVAGAVRRLEAAFDAEAARALVREEICGSPAEGVALPVGEADPSMD